MNTRHISSRIYQQNSSEKSDNKTRMEKSRLLLGDSAERKEAEVGLSSSDDTHWNFKECRSGVARYKRERNRRLCQEINWPRYNFRLWGSSSVQRLLYCAAKEIESHYISLTSGAYIDAHPSCGQNNVLWIGSKVNEPSDGEAFNCVLMCVLYKREEMYQREINILVVLLLWLYKIWVYEFMHVVRISFSKLFTYFMIFLLLFLWTRYNKIRIA